MSVRNGESTSDSHEHFLTHNPDLARLYRKSIESNPELAEDWNKLFESINKKDKPPDNRITRRKFTVGLGAALFSLFMGASSADRPSILSRNRPAPLPVDLAKRRIDKDYIKETQHKKFDNPFESMELLFELGFTHAEENQDIKEYCIHTLGSYFQSAAVFYAENDPKWKGQENKLIHQMVDDIKRESKELNIPPIILVLFIQMGFECSRVGKFSSKEYSEDVRISQVQKILKELVRTGIYSEEEILYSLSTTDDDRADTLVRKLARATSDSVPVGLQMTTRFLAPATIGMSDLEAEILALGIESLPAYKESSFDNEYHEVSMIFDQLKRQRTEIEAARMELLISAHKFVQEFFWEIKEMLFAQDYLEVETPQKQKVIEVLHSLGIYEYMEDTDLYHLTQPSIGWYVREKLINEGKLEDNFLKNVFKALSGVIFSIPVDVSSLRPDSGYTTNGRLIPPGDSPEAAKMKAQIEILSSNILLNMEITSSPNSESQRNPFGDSSLGVAYRDFFLDQYKNPKLLPTLRRYLPQAASRINDLEQKINSLITISNRMSQQHDVATAACQKYEYNYEFQMKTTCAAVNYFVTEARKSAAFQHEDKNNQSTIPWLLFISLYMREVPSTTQIIRGMKRPRSVMADTPYDIEGARAAMQWLLTSSTNFLNNSSPGDDFFAWLNEISQDKQELQFVNSALKGGLSWYYANRLSRLCPPTEPVPLKKMSDPQ